MIEFLTIALLLFGAAFVTLGSLGIARFPDTYCRIHANSKALTLGMAGLLSAAALHFDEPDVTAKCLLAIIFYFVTAPTAGHLTGRAAHRLGVDVWGEDVMDEYDPSSLAWHIPAERKEKRKAVREPKD